MQSRLVDGTLSPSFVHFHRNACWSTCSMSLTKCFLVHVLCPTNKVFLVHLFCHTIKVFFGTPILFYHPNVFCGPAVLIYRERVFSYNCSLLPSKFLWSGCSLHTSVCLWSASSILALMCLGLSLLFY